MHVYNYPGMLDRRKDCRIVELVSNLSYHFMIDESRGIEEIVLL